MSTTGNDTLAGTSGADTIDGLAGNDSIDGVGGNDTLLGNTGDDWLLGASGNDSLDGGAGYDAAAYNVTTDSSKPLTGNGVTVNLKTGVATDNWGDQDTLVGIESVYGSSLNDTLIGGNPANGQYTTDGWELFRGYGGDDFIDGGTGWDVADYTGAPQAVVVTLGGTGQGTASDGYGGTDTLVSIEDVRGSSYDDTLTGSDSGEYESFRGAAGNDVIDGKGGTDRADYSSTSVGVVADLVAGTVQVGSSTDTLRNIEDLRGSNYADTLRGDDGSNVFEGLLGDDLIDGRGGQDAVRYDRATGAVNVNLQTGQATGAHGTDTLISIEAVRGSNYADVLVGDTNSNRFYGLGGDDQVDGGSGLDQMYYSALAKSDCVITVSASGMTVSSASEGLDTLTGIERLRFTDQRLAFDLSGGAGDTAMLMGVLLGAASLQDKALVGQVLALSDGGMGLSAIADLAVTSGVLASLAGGAGNAAVARLVMRNVLGSDADTALATTLTGLLDSGSFTQAGLIAAAAVLDVNKTNVGLVGLAENGLAYL